MRKKKTSKFIKIKGKVKFKTARDTYTCTYVHTKTHDKIDNYPRMNSRNEMGKAFLNETKGGYQLQKRCRRTLRIRAFKVPWGPVSWK